MKYMVVLTKYVDDCNNTALGTEGPAMDKIKEFSTVGIGRMETVGEVLSQNLDIVDFLLDHSFNALCHEDKVLVKNHQRPCPSMKNLTNSKPGSTRYFSECWYTKYVWLCGSEKRNKLFCWYCLLFCESKRSPWNSIGYDNLKVLSKSCRKHDISKDHLYAALKVKLFGQQNSIISLDSTHRASILKHNEIVRQNRLITRRLINMVTYLAFQELSSGIHNESWSSFNQENFKELAKFACTFDETFKQFLDESSVFTELSETMQNELIESITKTVNNAICSEIKKASCFAWQVDKTTDSSGFSHLSVIFRYALDGQIIERFMGFFNVCRNKRADDLFQLLLNKFNTYNISKKLIGQTYDGASIATREMKAFQAKVKAIAPQAKFIHSYAHRLNLVLQDTTSEISDCRIFFANITGISSYFSKSTKRKNVLDKVGNKLSGVSEISQDFKTNTIKTVLNQRELLLAVFCNIIGNDDFARDHDSVKDAGMYITILNDFDFLFLLKTFDLIFEQTEIVYDSIQAESNDISRCQGRAEKLLRVFKKYRCDSQFKLLYDDTFSINGPPQKRRSLSDDTPKTYFERLFFDILDLCVQQIEVRFRDVIQLKFFDLLDGSKFESFQKGIPSLLLRSLIRNYPSMFDEDRLENELRIIYSNPHVIGQSRTLTDMFKFIFSSSLVEELSETYKLLSLLLTLPASSASKEHSFSLLKRIKKFARNSMSQSRLVSLSTLAIERDLVRRLQETSAFYDDVIDDFAIEKNRTIELVYKSL